MRTKYLWYIILFWIIVIIVSFSWNYYIVRTSIVKLVENKAQAFFSQIIVTRSWNSMHGGIYELITPNTQPNPYLLDSLRDLETINGLKLTKINPAFMTRQISEINKDENDLQFHITSLNPIRPGNKADLWESKALLTFEHNHKHSILELVETDSSSMYRYIAPLITEKSCLKCHAIQGYKVGDIRGGISISFPSAVYTKSQQSQIGYLLLAHLLILFLGLAGIYKYYITTSTYYSVIKTKNEKLEADDVLLRQTNKELKESLAQNRATVAAMPDVLFSFDSNGTLLNCQVSNTNPLSTEGETMIGKSLFDILPQPIAKQGINAIIKALETKTLQIFEYSLDLPTEQKWFELRIVSSAPGEVLAISRDITGRKQAEKQLNLKNQELIKLNAEKDKFFSIIAHDLRSPFIAFWGLSQIMAEDLDGLTMEEIQKYAVSMRDSATNLFGLLENLLEWSQLQRGLITFNPKSFLMIQKIEEIMQLVFETANKKGIKISYEIAGDLTVKADEYMFKSIIRNLVFNAVKFTNRGGRITIAAKSLSGDSVEISISDTGIGMSRVMVDNLFRLDVQTRRKGTESEPSSGLGLMLCKDFIEQHGGKIWADSIEGKGSTLLFTLPL